MPPFKNVTSFLKVFLTLSYRAYILKIHTFYDFIRNGFAWNFICWIKGTRSGSSHFYIYTGDVSV